MKLLFHPEAEKELNQAIEFYERNQKKLGLEFIEEVFYTIQRIKEFPTAYPKQSKNARKCLTNKFPFAIIYRYKKDELLIIAIAHLARKPGFWKQRL